jgi:hypothetical protein
LIILWSSPSSLWSSLGSTTWHGTYHFMSTHLAQWLVPRFSSIIQNQTRAFNLPLFGNWWQPIYEDVMIKIFWIHVACPSILAYVKDMDKFHEPKLVAIAPFTYVLRVWIWKLAHMFR